jgi:hypothetical protein
LVAADMVVKLDSMAAAGTGMATDGAVMALAEFLAFGEADLVHDILVVNKLVQVAQEQGQVQAQQVTVARAKPHTVVW